MRLIHVYRDGSVHLNHGGTEMGQGASHQGRAGRRLRVRQSTSTTSTSRRPEPTRCPTPPPPPPSSGQRSQRHGRAERLRADRGAAYGLRPRDLRRRRGAVRRTTTSCSRTAASRSPSSSTPPTWPASSFRRPASTRRRRSTGTARPAGVARSTLLRLRRRLLGGVGRHADGRVPRRPRRHPP